MLTFGSVEMWRCSGRFGLSVVSPFDRRCPNNLGVAPFHIPLIEPDVQISRIRLSDKTSRLHARQATPPRALNRTDIQIIGSLA